MSIIDWLVLACTLTFIVAYGIWKTRGSRNINSFLLADKSMKWWTICLSIMATQASAITFLSTPGQAFEDGMRFIQFYFGLPIAMVIIAATAVPLYARLKVFTVYQYLESRFDLKTRSLAAILFLMQRGLSTGITIYAPSLVLSAVLGWNLLITNVIIGGLVILYTVSGGTKAVSVTHTHQMTVMIGGMLIAGFVVVQMLPADISFMESVQLAGEMGKMNLVDFHFDPNERYNFWSGITGGLFLALSYFGTDQSQAGRYLSGKSITESRLGLLFNGLLKIPMQFMILFIGVMVFVFYQFHQPPVFFNSYETNRIKQSVHAPDLKKLEEQHSQLFTARQSEVRDLVEGIKEDNTAKKEQARENLRRIDSSSALIKAHVKTLASKASPDGVVRETKTINDTDYVFITFILTRLPHGLIGLLLAVIFCASMSSTASGLNSLASTTVVDIYKRSLKTESSDLHYVNASKLFTIGWGIFAIGFAMVTSLLENLIQAVNILGSLFYGTILGIFMAAFYFKNIRSNAVFIAALITQCLVLISFATTKIAYLWYNLIGCALVVLIALLIELFSQKKITT
ncbi:MAG: sodium:solute symporter [Cytophagaceae bacterium]